MNGHDEGSLYGLVPGLRAAYPGWCFAITRRDGGPRLEAYRPASAGGLYAVITDDVTELRQELDHADPAQAASPDASPCLPHRDLLPPPGRARPRARMDAAS